jgi:hypothetical protein
MPPPTRAQLAIERRIARERFMKARIAEREYARHLASIGRQVGAIVKGFSTKGVVDDLDAMKKSLAAYSQQLQPWAVAVTNRMLLDVSRRDLNAWKQLSHSLGSGLAKEIAKAPVGAIHAQLLDQHVTLITTIPLEAAERVGRLSLEALLSSERAEVVQREIMRSGQVSAFNAYRLARTAVSTTASMLTEARAIYIGSPGYWWRTSRDSDVRNRDGNPVGSHRLLEGVFVPWTKPPVVSQDGKTRAHAGQWVFCRCWPEPQLPDRVR